MRASAKLAPQGSALNAGVEARPVAWAMCCCHHAVHSTAPTPRRRPFASMAPIPWPQGCRPPRAAARSSVHQRLKSAYEEAPGREAWADPQVILAWCARPAARRTKQKKRCLFSVCVYQVTSRRRTTHTRTILSPATGGSRRFVYTLLIYETYSDRAQRRLVLYRLRADVELQRTKNTRRC